MSTVAFIFARGGSRGIKRKNLRHVAGRPLLAWAIEAAFEAETVDRVVVSTEDAEIAAVARPNGAGVLDRPPELATDDSPEWLSWQHAVRSVPCDLFVSVPCTAPLRLPSDIDAAVRMLLETGADGIISVHEAPCHPSWDMMSMDAEGRVRLLLPVAPPLVRRQEAPAAVVQNEIVHAYRASYMLQAAAEFQGDIRAVRIPRERAIDIDTELDLQIADFLMRKREKGEVAW